VPLYMYLKTHIHSLTHSHTHSLTHTHTQTHMLAHTQMLAHKYMLAQTSIYIYIYIYIYNRLRRLMKLDQYCDTSKIFVHCRLLAFGEFQMKSITYFIHWLQSRSNSIIMSVIFCSVIFSYHGLLV